MNRNRWFDSEGERLSIGVHLTLACLLVGMVLVILWHARSGNTERTARTLGYALAIALLISSVPMMRGTRSNPLPVEIGLLGVLITFSGLPGMIVIQRDTYGTGLLFFAALAVRNWICLAAVPSSLDCGRGRLDRAIVWWCYLACLVVVAGSLLLAINTGQSLESGEHLQSTDTDLWLNSNATAIYCAFAVLLSVIIKFAPLALRVPAGLIAGYCLMLTQSRTSIVALLGSLVAHMYWNGKRQLLLLSALAITGLVTLDLATDRMQDLLDQVPGLEAVVNKFQTMDPRTNADNTTRLDVIKFGYEMFQQSPVVGLGYAAADSRFENGYLSMACESGAMGLLFYLVFIVLVMRRNGYLLTHRPATPHHELGLYLACTTTFICVHSLGERSHGFTLGSPISNTWTLLIAATYLVSPRGGSRSTADATVHVPLSGLTPGGMRIRSQ